MTRQAKCERLEIYAMLYANENVWYLKKVGSVDKKNNNHLTNLLDWLIDLLVVNAGSAVFQPFNEC